VYFRKVTILGVGLIGASLALALKKYKLAETIIGYGRTEAHLVVAQERSIIDAFERDPARACDGADLIVFSTPVGIFLDLAKRISDCVREGALVTDVGSVKGELVREMERVLAPKGRFVGGHPIAGSDRSGIWTASADLFVHARCIVTPTPLTDKGALEQIAEMWRAVGSAVELLDPDEHDRIYAAVSHLLHVLVYELVNTVAEINDSYLAYSGQGFKDTTRIAASHPELWRDICLSNRDNIVMFLDRFQKNLDVVKEYLTTRDGKSLLARFEQARKLRERIGRDRNS